MLARTVLSIRTPFVEETDYPNQTASMLKLYAANNSICTQRVLIALAEKGLSFDTRNIDLFRNEHYAPWYLAINPEGVVPALDHNGNIVIESSLICEYLDEFFPTRPLKPAGTHARARMRLWSKAVDEGLFEATRELSFSAIFRDKMRRMPPQEREVRFRNIGDPVKRARFMSIYVEGVDSSYVFQGIAQFERAFDKMEKDLSDGQWLVGARLTLADISLMPFVARLAHLDLLDVWLSDRPASNAWWKRVQKLPSFKTAIQAQLSKSDITAMRTSGGKIRSRVAERRRDYLNQVPCGSAQLKDTKEVIDDQNR